MEAKGLATRKMQTFGGKCIDKMAALCHNAAMQENRNATKAKEQKPTLPRSDLVERGGIEIMAELAKKLKPAKEPAIA